MQDLAERVRCVRLLLATVDEPYPSPRDSIGGLEGRVAGPAPGRRVPCGVCAKTGRVMYSDGTSRLCPLCGGTTWRRRRKGEDAYDEYTGEPVGDSDSAPAHKTPFRLEDDYRKLGVQLEAVDHLLEPGRSPEYAWETVRRTWDRAGSYPELREALAVLAEHWPAGHAVIQSVWLRHVPVRMIGKAHDVEKVGVTWLAIQMQGEIRVPSWLLEDALHDRKLTFAEMVRAGHSASEIAKRLQMSKKRVKKMLKGARLRAA